MPDFQFEISLEEKRLLRRLVIETLDARTLTFDDLAKELGMTGKIGREKLLEIVSLLETQISPKLRTAFGRNREGQDIYAIYRIDQEVDLIKKGILGEERECNLTRLAMEVGFGGSKGLTPSFKKERK